MVYYINIFLEIILAMILLYGVLDNSQLLAQKVMSSERKKWYCIISGGGMDSNIWLKRTQCRSRYLYILLFISES